MTKVMILGDTHGNTQEAVLAVQAAGAMNIDTILQVGDFGLWDHFKDGVDFLDELNRELMDNEIILIWLDGNHENFDRLEWYCANNPKTTNGHVFIRTNILYSPRGLMWKMFGRTFMTVGGAVSVDKDWRKAQQGRRHTMWWPQEQLEDDQLDTIIRKRENDRVDVLLTHDCPTNAPFRGRFKEDQESKIHRQRMDKLGKAIEPKLWFHGHMHTQMDGYPFPEYNETTTVYGVDRDGSNYSYGVLDTDTLEFEWADPRLMYTMFYDRLDTIEPREPEGEWVEWKDEDWIGDNF